MHVWGVIHPESTLPGTMEVANHHLFGIRLLGPCSIGVTIDDSRECTKGMWLQTQNKRPD